ncbi:MAG: EpsI family protein [Desulfobacterales bacterium]|nr:EpsI family protein [Desulfobacterales bacterium]
MFKSNVLNHPLFQGTLLLCLFIGAYFVPLSALYHTWMTNDDYSYGLLIPFISGYLFWEQKNELQRISIQSFWPIFPVLVFFVAVSLYGVLGSSGHVARPAIPVLIVLFSLFCFGKAFFKKVWLPLCFTVFMVPLPTVLDRTVGVYLKSVSSEMGGAFLRIMGYSVYVTGNVIDLGVTKLQVVDACSGLRFVFPLIALGIVYGYFFEKVTWKRVVCVVVTIPIAVFTNVLRIGIAGILTYQWGSEMAEGFFHDFQGWAIFMVALVLLFVFGKVLNLIWPNREKKEMVAEPEEIISPKHKGNIAAFCTSIVLLVAVAVLTLNASALPPIKIKGGIANFPTRFDSWQGTPEAVDAEIIDASGAEEAFNCFYSNEAGEGVSLYMGYRSTAFLENENFFHSPTVCLPSSGWKVLEKSKYVIRGVPGFNTLPVTEMVIESMGRKQLVYFWFQTKDKATHDKNINRFHLALHALKKDNTHDLFIRPITLVKDGESLEKARQRLDGFTRQMMGTLLAFLDENQIAGS